MSRRISFSFSFAFPLQDKNEYRQINNFSLAWQLAMKKKEERERDQGKRKREREREGPGKDDNGRDRGRVYGEGDIFNNFESKNITDNFLRKCYCRPILRLFVLLFYF